MSLAKEFITESTETKKGAGIGLGVDGIIILIFGIIDIVCKHTINNMDYIVSGVIIVVTAILCLAAGVLLYKGQKIGYYLGWVASIVTVVLGALLAFSIVPNTMILGIYYFITGIFLVFYLATSKELKALIKQ